MELKKNRKNRGKIAGADRAGTSSSWSGRPSAAGEAHTYTWLRKCIKHMTASSTWLHQAHDCRILEKDQAVLATQLPGQKNLSLRLWIEIAIEKAFSNVENNYFCMKSTLFKPWNVLILMQNCRDVRFSKDIWTLMTPLNIQYDNPKKSGPHSRHIEALSSKILMKLKFEMKSEINFKSCQSSFQTSKSSKFYLKTLQYV